MNLLVSAAEAAFLILMIGWTLGSVLYGLPFRRVRHRLNKVNHGLWFADWTVFGTGRERAEIERFVWEYRDHNGAAWSEWIIAMHGRPWRWHAWIFQPERRLADRLHRIGKEIARANESGRAEAYARKVRPLIANYIDRAHPRAADSRREIRLTRRRSAIRPGETETGGERRVDESVVLSFRVGEA